MDSIGQLIEHWIDKTGGTQTDLSAKVGASQKSVSRWKNEETLPQAEFRDALLDALGVDENVFKAALQQTRANIREARSRGVSFAREAPAGARARLDIARWVAAVMQDGDLELLTRAALAAVPKFVEIPEQMQAFITPSDLVSTLPEANEANIEQIWAAMLGSGYLRPISASGRVFDLVVR